MDKRAFLGLGLLGLAGVVLGCAKPIPPAEPLPPSPPAGTPAATAPAGAQPTMAKCPKCGTENEVKLGPDGKPLEITCIKCGHKWTPKV